MSNVAISFASLVKSNNGFFKSEAQASFLLSQCQEENVFFSSGEVYNNGFMIEYICDDKGVIKVVKTLSKSGKQEVTFERMSDKDFSAKEAAKKASKARDVMIQENMNKAFTARTQAFQVALEAAQAYMNTLLNNMDMVKILMNNQDQVEASLSALLKDQAFSQAWEIYKDCK